MQHIVPPQFEMIPTLLMYELLTLRPWNRTENICNFLYYTYSPIWFLKKNRITPNPRKRDGSHAKIPHLCENIPLILIKFQAHV